MKTVKKYYHIKGTDSAIAHEYAIRGTENYIKASVWYDEGGYSFLSGQYSRRGYYMSAVLISKGRTSEISSLFGKGKKYLISEVSRQSKKREDAAIEYFCEHSEEFVKQIFPNIEFEEDLEVAV